MRNKLQLMFIFIAASIFVGAVSGQGIGDRNRPSEGGSHLISGKVYQPDGKPAAGVKLSISSPEIPGSTTNTNNDGQFTFSGLPAGNYMITVRANGYQTENESMTIERFAAAGQGYQMTFHLRVLGQTKTIPTARSNARLVGVPKDAVDKFEKGIDKMSKNDAKGAVASFDEAIAAYPQFAAAFYEKGAAYLKLSDPDKATESFVKAISIDNTYLEAKYGYGLAQFQRKNYEVSAAAFNDVLQQKQDMPEAHLNLGISLFYLKNVDAAEAELKKSVSTKGGEDLALAHLYLGQIYAEKKRNADAATELQKYLDLAPKAPNAERIKSAIANLKKQS